MRTFPRTPQKTVILKPTNTKVSVEEVKEQVNQDITRKTFPLVAKYVSGYKNHPSFTYAVPGINLFFRLKSGSTEHYLSTGTLDSYNRLLNNPTYTFGCGGCHKKCTVRFVEYPKDKDGLPDISKLDTLLI